MPIKFTGPVKPRKLKSPDPINMPIVRNDKVPRIKSEVLYYKENGSLPTDPGGDQTSGFGHGDWKAGDGLVTHDYYTGLDWLKMPATANKTLETVNNQTAAGSVYHGWRVANNYEVISFFNNIIEHTVPGGVQFDPTPGATKVSRGYQDVVDNAFKEWIGTVEGAAYGWWYEYASDQPSVTEGVGGGGFWPVNGEIYDWRYSTSEQRSNSGVFLVRNGTKPTYTDQTPPFPRGNFNPSNFYTDSVTGLKWLRLIYTDSVPIDEATSDPKYAGLRLATPAEVDELLFNYFGRSFELKDRAPSESISAAEREAWQDTFGITGTTSAGNSYGTWIDDTGEIRFSGPRNSSNYMYHGYGVGTDTSTARDQDGVFLVQE